MSISEQFELELAGVRFWYDPKKDTVSVTYEHGAMCTVSGLSDPSRRTHSLREFQRHLYYHGREANELRGGVNAPHPDSPGNVDPEPEGTD